MYARGAPLRKANVTDFNSTLRKWQKEAIVLPHLYFTSMVCSREGCSNQNVL
jgi:hypothetical protein